MSLELHSFIALETSYMWLTQLICDCKSRAIHNVYKAREKNYIYGEKDNIHGHGVSLARACVRIPRQEARPICFLLLPMAMALDEPRNLKAKKKNGK